MNEEFNLLLSRAFDDDLSPEEMAEFEALKAENADIQEAWNEMAQCRELMRAHIEEETRDVDFSHFYDEIAAKLPQPEPQANRMLASLKSWWKRHWMPMLASSAATAIAALVISHLYLPATMTPGAQTATIATAAENDVFVDSVQNSGPNVVMISQPVDQNSPTVIWLLDEEEAEDFEEDGVDDKEPI